MNDLAFYSTSNCSFSDFDNHIPDSNYSDAIEAATNDELRAWILKQGLTQKDIMSYHLEGMSMKDVAYEIEKEGVSFPY